MQINFSQIDSNNMIKNLHARWQKPTPPRFRKLGKAIGALGAMLQVTLAGVQTTDIFTKVEYVSIVIGITILTWAGQTITDFATEDETVNTIQNGQV
jgi:hypothetical protein